MGRFKVISLRYQVKGENYRMPIMSRVTKKTTAESPTGFEPIIAEHQADPLFTEPSCMHTAMMKAFRLFIAGFQYHAIQNS